MVNRFGIGRFFVLIYEFINGFHDTANAVATVIYTKRDAGSYGGGGFGLSNFAGGVMLGGLGWPTPSFICCPSILLPGMDSTQGSDRNGVPAVLGHRLEPGNPVLRYSRIQLPHPGSVPSGVGGAYALIIAINP